MGGLSYADQQWQDPGKGGSWNHWDWGSGGKGDHGSGGKGVYPSSSGDWGSGGKGDYGSGGHGGDDGSGSKGAYHSPNLVHVSPGPGAWAAPCPPMNPPSGMDAAWKEWREMYTTLSEEDTQSSFYFTRTGKRATALAEYVASTGQSREMEYDGTSGGPKKKNKKAWEEWKERVTEVGVQTELQALEEYVASTGQSREMEYDMTGGGGGGGSH